MKPRSLFRAAALIAAAAALSIVLFLAGLIGFLVYSAHNMHNWNAPLTALSDSLTRDEAGEYAFTGGERLDAQQLWAILIDASGQVVWSYKKPETVPTAYGLTDVAAFTRWYLDDYPVQTRIRPDGLLVVGAARNTQWKYLVTTSVEALYALPYWLAGLFLLVLSCIVGLSALVLRRGFRRTQRTRDTARANWINGISHDIRTPLSMVMGYASEMERDDALPAGRRTQAAIIRRQSQIIKDLVGDLNLTMRLDYDMQPLRRTSLSPAAIVRQVAADFLNGELEDCFPLAVALPQNAAGALLEADGVLLRRALSNLVLNCIRHNPDGCAIVIGADVLDGRCALWVQGGGADPEALRTRPAAGGPAPDGSAAHGTGLRLVEQIARVHGGSVRYEIMDGALRCTIDLPL